ncbi:MAG TPA: hypothetical protein VE152_07940 [Acidimicrobiales bacterium]|nr:hypothetical protein [Acidimicrobiales bacterium]
MSEGATLGAVGEWLEMVDDQADAERQTFEVQLPFDDPDERA